MQKIEEGDILICKSLTEINGVPISEKFSPGYEFKVIKIKNDEWFFDGESWFYIDDIVILEKVTNIPQLNKESIEKILSIVFNDNWEVTPDRIRIYFPEVIIKNSLNSSHKIKDLFVEIALNNNYNIYSRDLYGFRTTVSEIENQKNYLHSHLHSGRVINTERFCLGDGTIVDLIEMLIDKNIFEKEEIFELFLEEIKTYVAWESLEGGPYVRMEALNSTYYFTKDISDLSYSDYQEKFNNLIKDIEIPIDFSFDPKTIEDFHNLIVINKREYEKKIVEKIINNPTDDNVIFLATKNNNTRGFSGNANIFKRLINTNNETEDIVIKQYDSYIMFKGEKKYAKIIATSDTIKVESLILGAFFYKYIDSITLNFYQKLINGRENFVKVLTNS